MCEYCGCREVPAVSDLMSEHRHLLDEADHIRRAMVSGDREAVSARLRHLVSHLQRHVSREEAGIFTALRDQGDYVDEVTELEGEHRWLDAAIADLDPADPELDGLLAQLFETLDGHIAREDLGIFPVSVVTLGAAGWDLVARVHEQQPSFLQTSDSGVH